MWISFRPAGPVAERGTRIGARMLDLLAGGTLALTALALFGDGDRPVAGVVLVWAVLTVYEAVTTTLFGATLGKAAVGLRVVGLDSVHHPEPGRALRRSATVAALLAVPIVGWAVIAIGTLIDPLGRGVADRLARTMVVPRRTPLPIATRDLAGYADGARRPRVIPLGRVGDLDVRGRARLRRLNDAPLLAALVGLLALATAVPVSTATFVLASSALWVAAFVVDETRRVHRHGATVGHRLAGLVIRDHRTGAAPSGGRSFLRALVLGLTLYVPLLWPLLVASLVMMRFGPEGRGLHDLAGGTVVVGDPALDPETQRRRAMRMRLGEVS
jgi:uncharacterized RDD family membrane protein YckC